ncbi:MAG: type II CAAX prenyl endopeptidase Rce1 family protein [Candidatus Neomarinimicrobiota bacterium]
MMYLYFKDTKSPFYGFIFTIPLFLIYELGIIINSNESIISMRNGADVLLRQILSFFGLNGIYWLGFVFFVAYLITFFFHKSKMKQNEINNIYLFIMIIESLCWAILIYLFMSNIHILLMNPTGSIILQKVTLAIGAGIYEEFLFRVLLILLLSQIIKFIFKWTLKFSSIVAMIISAGIFSSFHFLGEYGDYFSFNIFMIRFFAGIFLGMIYFTRGFGIVAWSHSIYDLIVLTKITTN